MHICVTIHDCEVQTFRSGGKGGQNQNTRDTGVRVIHHPSGARAECRETRSQDANKKRAFRRMTETALFMHWANPPLVLPPSSSDERIRTYNFIAPFVKDHRTKRRTSDLTAVLDGDLDLLR